MTIVAAYIWWAFSVFYYKAVAHVSALEVLAHRITWSLVFLVGLMVVKRRLANLALILCDIRTLSYLLITASLLGFVWYLFVWSIINDYILQISMGYFIYPLINILLGSILLKEKLQFAQIVSVILVLFAVIFLGLTHRNISGIALIFAISFSLYGLFHKRISTDPISTLVIETAALLPLALAYLGYLGNHGNLAFTGIDIRTDLLLIAAGIITALPLIWFNNALKRIRYSSLGMMIFIMPSITLLIAIFINHEPFYFEHLITFILIWIALGIYSYSQIG
jgi:chloramphenicol-sensitive protein RarD